MCRSLSFLLTYCLLYLNQSFKNQCSFWPHSQQLSVNFYPLHHCYVLLLHPSYCPFGPSGKVGVCQGVFILWVCWKGLGRQGVEHVRGQRIFLFLDMTMIFGSVYIFLSSLFFKNSMCRFLEWSQKIFLKIFLSNVFRDFISLIIFKFLNRLEGLAFQILIN